MNIQGIRRVGQVINRYINLWAVLYVAGLYVMVGPAQSGLGWPFARAIVWVLAVPGFYFWGISDGRRNGDGAV